MDHPHANYTLERLNKYFEQLFTNSGKVYVHDLFGKHLPNSRWVTALSNGWVKKVDQYATPKVTQQVLTPKIGQ